MTTVKRFISDNSGSTAIEFAFIFPVFITMVLGIIEFGMMVYMRGAIEEVTRSSARLAVTGSMIGGDASVSRTDSIRSLLEQRTNAVAVGNGDITIRATSHPNLASYSSAGAGSGGFGAGNSIVEYEVNYNYGFFTPLAAFVEVLTGDVTIISTAVVQNEDF